LKLATFWGDVTMLRDIRLTLFVSPYAKRRDAYFLRFQGWGLTTRKIDSCTFVANDTLGPKGREACFLGAWLAHFQLTNGINNNLVTCLLLSTNGKSQISSVHTGWRMGGKHWGVKFSTPLLTKHWGSSSAPHSMHMKIEQSLSISYG